MHDHLRGLQHPQSLDRQQVRVARTRANQPNHAFDASAAGTAIKGDQTNLAATGKGRAGHRRLVLL